MTHEPRTQEEIYESLRSSLTGQIAKLTNFTDRSFNFVWTQAFAEEVRELEVLAVVSELAGWIDYTGGPITEDDLEQLDIADDITAEEVNEFMKDDYLDEYVKIVGVTRLPGSRATGDVTFTTQSANTEIPSGTRVSTVPDSDGNTIDFLTTEQAETSTGVTTVTDVPIQAVDVGTEFNVPANEIVRLADPPIGVKGVDNPSSTTGGEAEESNEELRARAKTAVQSSSQGGTADGIKGYIRQNVEGVGQGDIIIDEFTDPCPPFVDVIVDGGLDVDVSDAIEFSRPTGIRHNLIRPQVVQLAFDVDVLGTDIGTTDVEEEIEDFLLNRGISEEFYQDELIRQIMNSDPDILNIDNLGGTVEKVTNEVFDYITDVDAAVADDGGTTTDETAEANDDVSNDMTLLPSSPAVGDAYYFGEETIFSQMELNVSQAGAGTWDIVWEYYDGSAWVSLANVTDGTSDFQSSGVGTVSWDIPSDWVSTNVGGVDNLYWVRGRLDTFTSISTQPLGQEVDIDGSGFTLDYTYENTNGTITIADNSGGTYTENTDFITVDNTGDGWPETVVWSGGATPDEDEQFFVDYDVTVIGSTTNGDKYTTDLVRDEAFYWSDDSTETFTYNNTQDLYEMEEVPFDNSTSIEDASGDTYVEGTDYDIIDNTGNGVAQTIDWTVGGGTPDNSEDFTITYEKKVYVPEYEIVETPKGEITDASGDTYEQDVDYDIIDVTQDDENDAISWITNPASLGDGEQFFFTYFNEGDINFGNREKADPGTISVTQV